MGQNRSWIPALARFEVINRFSTTLVKLTTITLQQHNTERLWEWRYMDSAHKFHMQWYSPTGIQFRCYYFTIQRTILLCWHTPEIRLRSLTLNWSALHTSWWDLCEAVAPKLSYISNLSSSSLPPSACACDVNASMTSLQLLEFVWVKLPFQLLGFACRGFKFENPKHNTQVLHYAPFSGALGLRESWQ
jgi:hypothetical protein